jgi:DNA-directed RNA polymerase sigma subunit (sigma70/sigma32)
LHRRSGAKWIRKRPTYWHDYYVLHRDVYVMRSRFRNPLSLSAPLAENFTLLDAIADEKALTPLDAMLEREAVASIVQRLVAERGLSPSSALRLVESYL